MLLYCKAVALIRHQDGESVNWLVRWDAQREESAMVEAARLEAESYREALFREIDWQLSLDRKRDYLLSSVPRLHLEVSPCGHVHPPKTFDYETSDFGIVELYTAEIYRESVKRRLDEDANNCWTTAREIWAGVDGQGRALRLDQFQLLTQSEAISKFA